MKKIIIFLLILFFSGGMYAAQLSYRFANPRIIRLSAVDHLQFDVQVQCDEANTYLWAATIKFNFNNTTFSQTASQWVVTKVGDFNGMNTNSAFKYNITKTISGTAPNKVYNIAVLGDNNVFPNGPSPEDFVAIPTTWTTIVTVSARLSVLTGDALAGLDFYEAGMNGATTQQYITGPSTVAYYANPSYFDLRNFTNAYTGRFYSTAMGWSQIGGSTNNVQYNNWATNVSTTVWEDASISQTDNTEALAKNLLIENNTILTVPSNKWLTVSGTLTNPAATGLVVESDGSLMHNTDNVPATIKRIVTGSTNTTDMMYHFVSVPLTAASNPTSNLFFGSFLFEFEENTNSWNGLGSATDTPLDVTRGYMMYYHGGASVTNTFEGPMNNGLFTALTSFTSGNGYNLVPNPYPSAIDWLTGNWVKTGIDNATYIWPAGAAANSGNYVSFVGGVGVNGGTQFIPVGQSFFVHANASPLLSMDNTVRVHNAQLFWKEDEVISDMLRINVFANNASDETVIRFTESATSNFDGELDAYKLIGGNDAPQLNSVAEDNSMLCINSMPLSIEESIVPLSFILNSDTVVSFTVSGLGSFRDSIAIFIEDRLLNTSIDLRENPSFSFIHHTDDDPLRFRLHFYGVNATAEKEIEYYRIWSVADQVNIFIPALTGQNAIVELYDVLGYLLYGKQVVLGSPTEMNTSQFKGVGIVRVIADKKVFLEKVFIR